MAHHPKPWYRKSRGDQLVDDVSCFLLAGRPWVVLQIQHDERRVIVDPAPRGRQPTWGGYLPQFLSSPLCQKIRDVLTSPELYGYLTPEAATVLHEERAKMHGVIKPEHDGIETSDGQIQWWTFAGGRINSTLRYALAATEQGWSFIPDNFSITVRGDTLNIERFLAARQQLLSHEFWHNTEFWQTVAASLPNYRLSKFQPLMPSWVEQEVIAAYLLDAAGACHWLSMATGRGRDALVQERRPDGAP